MQTQQKDVRESNENEISIKELKLERETKEEPKRIKQTKTHQSLSSTIQFSFQMDQKNCTQDSNVSNDNEQR